jgi:hypothetical protein
VEKNLAAEEDLKVLDFKMNQLKREYEQYFLGTRPREPVLLAGDVRKTMARLSNNAFQNTALKFKFASCCSRYQAYNRQWQENLRKIEMGPYERHQFKAELHGRNRSGRPKLPAREEVGERDRVYAAYLEARRACGQDVENLTPARLEVVLKKQEEALRDRYGKNTAVRFRVVVEDGRAKLKASRAER